MLTIGVDAHKGLHMAVAVNEAGQEVGQWRGQNSSAGWQCMLEWAAGFGDPRQWGIEGAWNYGRGLAQQLVATEETVYEVNARWTALERRRARRPGKTDRLDARAVALFVRQEAPNLPRVFVEDATAVLDLLTSEREAALADAVRLRNRIHVLLMQLDPLYREHLPSLNSGSGLNALERYVAPQSSPVQRERSAAVQRLMRRLRLATDQVEELERQIKALTKEEGFSPLTNICGVNLLTAATLAGILGPGRRFSTDAEVAAYAGAAPLEASSAGIVRHRLNRGGNRRLNAVLYMITLTQVRCWPPAKSYVARRMAEGKTRREAVRALKRFVVRAVWQQWLKCEHRPSGEAWAQVA